MRDLPQNQVSRNEYKESANVELTLGTISGKGSKAVEWIQAMVCGTRLSIGSSVMPESRSRSRLDLNSGRL